MTAHLKGLLEIKFWHPPSKYEDCSPFSHPTGDALTSIELACSLAINCFQNLTAKLLR